MSLMRIPLVLLARWKIALLVFLAASAGGVSLVWNKPQSYFSTATVLLDARVDPIAGTVHLTAPNFIATQIEIIRSSRVAYRAIRSQALDQDAQLQAQFLNAGLAGPLEDWLAGRLQAQLVVEPGRGSNVIRIGYVSPDPDFAAAMANAFTKAYLDTVLEMRLESARRYSQFFDDRARAMRDALEKAQARLSAYQREQGITATDERLDIESAKLGELSSQLLQAETQAIESSNRHVQARAATDRTQEVLSSGLIAALKADAAKQEAKLRELGARLGENHPQVVEIKASLAELKASIGVETERVMGAVGIGNTVARQRHAQVRAALEAQRAKVLRLKDTRDEMAVLQRDVENAQRAYDGIQQRLNQSSLESENQQTNLSVLNRAERSSESATRKRAKNVLKVIALALGLAGAAALAVEFLDRRVRMIEDITSAADVPVIGLMPSAKRRGWLRRGKSSMLERSLLRQLPRLERPKAAQ